MNMLKSTFAIFLLSATLISCGQSTNNNNTNNASKTDDLELFKKSVNTIRPNIRNIEDVSALLYLSGADYIPGLVNDPMNWERYQDKDVVLAANMGAYVVDGLYQAAFHEKKSAYMSFMASKSIATHLGVSNIFEEMIIKRLNEGVVPEDALIERFNELLFNAEVVFNEKEANRLFTALLTGTYIEKQYLLFSSIFSLPEDLTDEEKLMLTSRLIITTSEELKQLPELLKIIESHKVEGEKLYLYDRLVELEQLRSKLNLGDAFEKTKPEDFFSNPELNLMHNKLIEVRDFMVSVK